MGRGRQSQILGDSQPEPPSPRRTRPSNANKHPGARDLPGWDQDEPDRPPTPPRIKSQRKETQRKEQAAILKDDIAKSREILKKAAAVRNEMNRKDLEAATNKRKAAPRPVPAKNANKKGAPTASSNKGTLKLSLKNAQ